MKVRYGIPINISVGMNSTDRTIIESMYVEIYWPKQNQIFDKYTCFRIKHVLFIF